MAEKEEKNNPNQANSGGGNDSGQKMLYGAILFPDDERLPEFSDLPLMQINMLTMMATYDLVFKEAIEGIQYAIDLRKYENAARNSDNHAKKPKLPKVTLPAPEWRRMYYKHRRSLAGSTMKTGAVLAERQIEVQQEQPTDELGGAIGKD